MGVMKERFLSAYHTACVLYYSELARCGWDELTVSVTLAEARGVKRGCGEACRLFPEISWEDVLAVSEDVRAEIWANSKREQMFGDSQHITKE